MDFHRGIVIADAQGGMSWQRQLSLDGPSRPGPWPGNHHEESEPFIGGHGDALPATVVVPYDTQHLGFP